MAPMMLVSSVLIPAIIVKPLPAVGSALKSTPKKSPQVMPMALMK